MGKKRLKRFMHPHELTLKELIGYNVLFFVPLLLSFWLSFKLAQKFEVFLQASPFAGMFFFANIFAVIIFAFIIPFLQKRENINGVRYSILGFAIVGIGITLPSALQGNFNLLLSLPSFFASYLLLTFIFAPEVLGVERNIQEWFLHKRQFLIILVYLAIALLYMVGFGFNYHLINQNSATPNAFSFDHDEIPTLGTFVYYSTITFATIGYGDITPVSRIARMMTSFEAILGMIVNIIFIAILLMYVSGSAQGQERRILREEKVIEKKLRKYDRRRKGRKR